MMREASVPGGIAAGDAGPPPQSVAGAAASGATAAAFLDHALCGEDAEAETATPVDGAGGSVRKEAV